MGTGNKEKILMITKHSFFTFDIYQLNDKYLVLYKEDIVIATHPNLVIKFGDDIVIVSPKLGFLTDSQGYELLDSFPIHLVLSYLQNHVQDAYSRSIFSYVENFNHLCNAQDIYVSEDAVKYKDFTFKIDFTKFYQDFYKFYTYGPYIVASKLKELFRKDIHTALEGLQRTEELLATKFKDIDIDLPEFRRSELPKRHYIAVKDNLSEPYEGEVWDKHNLAFLKEAAILSKWEAEKVAAILQLYSGSEFVVIEKEYKI